MFEDYFQYTDDIKSVSSSSSSPRYNELNVGSEAQMAIVILEVYDFMMKRMMMRKRRGVGFALCLLQERDVCQSHGCLLLPPPPPHPVLPYQDRVVIFAMSSMVMVNNYAWDDPSLPES